MNELLEAAVEGFVYLWHADDEEHPVWEDYIEFLGAEGVLVNN